MPVPRPRAAGGMTPHYATADGDTVRMYLGHVTDVLAKLPAGSVHCCVTSPPYWGLRSYLPDGHEHKALELGAEPSPDCGSRGQSQCGACFVCNLVGVFRQVRRVLHDAGTVWLNLGDSYGSSGNLVGVPWRVALALQADGWVLRQDIVWAKPSPMPESVRDRCTKAHEYVFLLAKGKGYFYDQEAVKEPGNHRPAFRDKHGEGYHADLPGGKTRFSHGARHYGEPGTRNKRDVWAADSPDGVLAWLAEHHPEALDDYLAAAGEKGSVWRVSSQGYPGAHFATFPPRLIEPMVLAGTSAAGCCPACGAPHRRLTARTKLRRPRPNEYVKRTGEPGTGSSCANTVAGVATETLGWESGCACDAGDPVPCTVLDPFLGAATTAVVCLRHGRRCVGVELSRRYLDENAVPRVEGELLSVPALRHLARPRPAASGHLGRPVG